MLTPTLLPNLLLASREALFPHNTRPKPGGSGVNRTEDPTPTASTPVGAQSSTINNNNTQATPASGGNAITQTHIAATAGSSPLSPDQQRRASNAAEVASIRRKCALGILSLIPRPIARRVLGVASETGIKRNSIPPRFPAQALSQFQDSEPEAGDPGHAFMPPDGATGSDGDAEEELLASTIETEILDLFADEYCNKHLIYSIIETLLARLLPELSDRSIAELMEDRGVFVSPG